MIEERGRGAAKATETGVLKTSSVPTENALPSSPYSGKKEGRFSHRQRGEGVTM